MDSFPTNDELHKLELIFKLTKDILGSSKIVCLLDLYLKDEGSSLDQFAKIKDDFTLSTLKVSQKIFSNHIKLITKMCTIRPWTGSLSGLCLLLGD